MAQEIILGATVGIILALFASCAWVGQKIAKHDTEWVDGMLDDDDQ